MTDLQIRVDATQAIGLMGRISTNFPTARTWALNRTAEDVTFELRREASSRMMFRGPAGRRTLEQYAPPRILREYRATDAKPYVTIEPYNAGKILRPFETGTPRMGTPTKPAIIPTYYARPEPGASIPKKLFPHNLWPAINEGKTLKSGKAKRSKSWKQVRPFVLDPTTMHGLGPKAWGIYVRTGQGRGDIRMLWAFRRQVARPKLLTTHDTSRRVVMARWQPNMVGAFRQIVNSPSGKASLLDLTV
jgi:hypothetical protein